MCNVRSWFIKLCRLFTELNLIAKLKYSSSAIKSTTVITLNYVNFNRDFNIQNYIFNEKDAFESIIY